MTENIPKDKISSKSFNSKQITVYQFIMANTDVEKLRLSNTIKLWDCIPKYFLDKKKQSQLRKDGILPTIEKDFKFEKNWFKVTLRPARLTVDGKDMEFFPSDREFVVELALRKLALTPGSGFWEPNRSGVQFTLYKLREELKSHGHTYSYAELKQALYILDRVTVELESFDGKMLSNTSPIKELAAVSNKDISKDAKAQWYVEFSSFVTKAIETGSYRQHDYAMVMRHRRNPIARYMNIRMTQVFRQAAPYKSYTVNLLGIERDSGLLGNKRMKDNAAKFCRALDVLKEDGVLSTWMVKKEVRDGTKLLNVFYDLFPTQEYSDEVKRSHAQVSYVNSQL